MKPKVSLSYGSIRLPAIRIRYHKPGEPPGTLGGDVSGAAAVSTPARLSLMRYDQASLDEKPDVELAECTASAADAAEITWLHVQGAPTPEQLQQLGTIYGLHPLALEDVFNQERRPKFESYEEQYFVVLNHPRRDENKNLCVDQVSFFLGKNYVISIDEGPKDSFEPIRQRVRNKQTLRSRGADYLLYALMDVIVDGGFPLLEDLGEQMERLEDVVLDNPSREVRNRIHYLKRELVQLRRSWWPQREVISSLIRDGEQFLSENTRLYMRDCYDHSVIMMDFVETYREMMSSLLDTYLSSISQRMNDIMKALTMIATIFLPLSFIAGLYGMNFSHEVSHWNMPELTWHFGYFYALGVMALIVILMLIYFRRKRWL
ncbi:MAG: magnesium/cobalt transporter CorA [Gammaproteobacteria bacterium]